MDESLQKNLATNDNTPRMREHWVWMGGDITGPRCRLCDARYPQKRETCIQFHSSTPETGGPRLVLEPPVS